MGVRTFFVIPVYNERQYIRDVIDRIARDFTGKQWVVVAVNDGSTDDTGAILDALQSRLGEYLRVIANECNQGVPEALYRGYRAVVESATDQDQVICIEGDGTSDPLLYPELLARLDTGADIVIASRYAPHGKWLTSSWHRRWISQMGNWGLRMLFPYPNITDYTIFYRAYRASFLKGVLAKYGRTAFTGRNFSANTALLLACLRERPVVVEVAHQYRYHKKKSDSGFRIVDAIWGYASLAIHSGPVGWRRMISTGTIARTAPLDDTTP